MADISRIISNSIQNYYTQFNTFIPEEYRYFLNFFIFLIFLTVYSIFIWKFYRFLGKRDLLELNLAQYNRYDHAVAKKVLAMGFFILEYIIILPVIVFFWCFIVAIMLLFWAKDLSINAIIIISASLVGAIRISSYYNENLSQELSKLLPLNILAVLIITPNFFDIPSTIAKIASIGELFNSIIVYLLIIALLELVLRLGYLIMPDFDDDNKN